MKTKTPSDLHDYGTLLLASRLRRLSEALYAGVDDLYRARGVELPSRAIPILLLLRDHGRLGISELAAKLGQSHPAVSQMSRTLLRHAVVSEWPDADDNRRRLLGLSPGGAALLRRLRPVWEAIDAAMDDMPGARRFSHALTELDRGLEARGFAQRVNRHLRLDAKVAIIPFSARYAGDFARLNLAWLEKYFQVEAVDRRVLSKPDQLVRAGGEILFARSGREIVGTCALLKKAERRYELSKMAVAESWQGLGIGRKLLTAAIARFAALGGDELFLETNSALRPAIALYRSMGFVHARAPHVSPYRRANVYMVHAGAARRNSP